MIGGLCQVKPGLTDILAIASEQEGKGNFTRFLDALEPMAGTVTFWSMMSDRLAEILRKRDYKLVTLRDRFGKVHQCMSKTLWGDGERVQQNASIQAGNRYGGQSPMGRGGSEALAVGGI